MSVIRRLGARVRSGSAVLVFLGFALWAVLSALLVSRDPWLGVIVGVAPILLYLVFRSAVFRLALVIGGGMLVLGSSSDVNAAKLIYAPLVMVSAAISAYRLMKEPPHSARQFRPLIWWGLAIAGVVMLSFIASPAGADPAVFARQSIFYVLIVVGPLIGFDAGRDIAPRAVYGLVGVLGAIAAVGYATDWLDRRGVSNLPFGRFVLSSLALPSLAFALALVMVIHSSRMTARVAWGGLLLLVPIAMLVTGSRTNLILFAAVPMVVGRLRYFRVPPMRMLGLIFAGVAVGSVTFGFIAQRVVADPTYLMSRVQASLLVLGGQGAADQSFAIRSAQFQDALAALSDSPLLGMGLGYQLEFGGDTFLLTPVRIGWLGTSLVLAFLVALSVAVWASRRRYGASPAHVAWWGFIAVTLANVPFGSPFEDRGFGFTIMLATMALSSALTHSSHFGSGITTDVKANSTMPARGDRARLRG